MDDIQSGKGSLGPLFTSDEAYKKAISAIDKLNAMVDDVQQGKGTAGKLLKDPALYDNANKAIANVRQLTDDINAGKGAIGKMAHDEEFAAHLQTLMNNLVGTLRSVWKKAKVRRGCCSKIPRCTTTAIRCWWRRANW